MKLRELWDVTILPMKDMESGKDINSDVMKKDGDREVETLSMDDHFNFLVKYEKEPEDA